MLATLSTDFRRYHDHLAHEHSGTMFVSSASICWPRPSSRLELCCLFQANVDQFCFSTFIYLPDLSIHVTGHNAFTDVVIIAGSVRWSD